MADSMFIHMLNRLGDVLLLSIITIVFCIPVVTIGASLSAAAYTSIHSIQGDDGYIWKKFWKSFKQNFKQSTIAWLIMAFIGFTLYIDIFFWNKMSQANPGDIHKIMLIISCVLAVIYACIFVHVFALIGNYENTVKKAFSNASILAIAQFPWTLLMLIIAVATFLVVRIHVLFIITFMFAGAGVMAYIFGAIRIQVYKRAMRQAETARENIRKAEEADDEDDEDEDGDDADEDVSDEAPSDDDVSDKAPSEKEVSEETEEADEVDEANEADTSDDEAADEETDEEE